MTIYDILKDSDYKAEQFSDEAIARLNARIEERVDKKGKISAVAKCIVRKKDIILKPEEVIRQLFIDKLIYDHTFL